ncbi:hypothetical protein C3L33_12122, partial [Rhododendron williamsianum]
MIKQISTSVKHSMENLDYGVVADNVCIAWLMTCQNEWDCMFDRHTPIFCSTLEAPVAGRFGGFVRVNGVWGGFSVFSRILEKMEVVMYLNQDLPSPTKNIVLYNKMRKVVVECKSKISNKVMLTAHFGGVVVNEKGHVLVVSHAPPLGKEDIVEMNIRKVGMKLFGQQCVLPKTRKGV